MDGTANGLTHRPRIVATYPYFDESGQLLFEVVRKEPGPDGAAKTFLQRRRDGRGGWIWNRQGVRNVPYRLPELAAADPSRPVFIVEGEKDVETLRGLGQVATCNAGGALKWESDFATFLRGRDVVIIPDNDDRGREHALDVARKLLGVGLCASVRFLPLPESPEKGDVTDWLAIAGNNLDRLLELPRFAPDELTRQNEPAAPARAAGPAEPALYRLDTAGGLPIARSPIEGMIEMLKSCPEGMIAIYRHPEILQAMAKQAEDNPAEHALCREFVRREGLIMPDFEKALAPYRKILRYANGNGKANGNGNGHAGQGGDGADGEDGKPVIVITAQADEVNDQAIAALAGDPELYQRGNLLVRLVWKEEGPPDIKVLQRPTLRERLAARARFVRNKDGEHVAALPPDWCVQAVDARGTYPGVRALAGVVDHPVLRPDGTILDVVGYDPATRLYYTGLGALALDLPERPTRAQARDAADELLVVVQDFPMAGLVHAACWLAGLLTPLARFAFSGPAPLFLIDGNAPGAGKGLLTHVINTILSGKNFATSGYSDDEEEMRKKITTLAVAGKRTVLLDNIEGRFGNAQLDRALTSTDWTDRLLGGNAEVTLPLAITWYATGNNVSLGGDIMRRVCYIRLESPLERPGERKEEDFRYPNLLEHVKENRGRLLSAALTILRAYATAGRPKQKLKAWGSFEAWSQLVRGAIAWVGLPDPAAACVDLQERADLAGEHMRVLLAAWHELDPHGEGLTAGDVIDKIKDAIDRKKAPLDRPPECLFELKDALEGLGCRLEASALGYRLRKFTRRNFGGFYVDRLVGDRRRKLGVRWIVRRSGEFLSGPGSPPTPGSTSDDPGSVSDGGDAGRCPFSESIAPVLGAIAPGIAPDPESGASS